MAGVEVHSGREIRGKRRHLLRLGKGDWCLLRQHHSNCARSHRGTSRARGGAHLLRRLAVNRPATDSCAQGSSIPHQRMPDHAAAFYLEKSIAVGSHAVITILHGIGKKSHQLVILPAGSAFLRTRRQAAEQRLNQFAALLTLQPVIILQQCLQHQPHFLIRQVTGFLLSRQVGQQIPQAGASAVPVCCEPVAAEHLRPGLLVSHLRGHPLRLQLGSQLNSLLPQHCIAVPACTYHRRMLL